MQTTELPTVTFADRGEVSADGAVIVRSYHGGGGYSVERGSVAWTTPGRSTWPIS